MANVDVKTLKDHRIAFLETDTVDDVVVGYEWTAVLKTTKKVKQRPHDGHVVAEVRYPEGLRDVDLSDGKVYGVDWFLLSGAGASKAKRKADTPPSNAAGD